MLRRTLLFALLLECGCTNVSRCKNGTLLVHLTLGGGAVAADQLVVAVTLDNGAPFVNPPQPHKPGAASGDIEIDFRSGYPQGSTITVEVRALQAGTQIGDQQTAPVVLRPGCTNTSLSIGVSADLAPASDLSGADGPAPVDLAGVDLFGVDLSSSTVADLRSADLANCVPTTENCFNGIDDDCDGLVDCADPDCTGGASPPATCVPDPGSFTAGVTVASAIACPGTWPSPGPINAGINSTCDGTGCSGCSLISDWAQTDDCYVVVYDWGATMCLGGSGTEVRTSGVCRTFDTPAAAGNYHSVIDPYYEGFCSGVGGTATKVTPTWTTSEQFCSGGLVGGGCTPGSICVPAGPNHCVMKSGSQLTCPANYVLRATRYYTGFDDSGRTCACACNRSGTGTCSGTATVALFSGSCAPAGGHTLASACDNTDNISGYDHVIATGVTVVGHTSCTLGTSQTNSTALLDEQTVCCTP